jgi:hypothetical protein
MPSRLGAAGPYSDNYCGRARVTSRESVSQWQRIVGLATSGGRKTASSSAADRPVAFRAAHCRLLFHRQKVYVPSAENSPVISMCIGAIDADYQELGSTWEAWRPILPQLGRLSAVVHHAASHGVHPEGAAPASASCRYARSLPSRPVGAASLTWRVLCRACSDERRTSGHLCDAASLLVGGGRFFGRAADGRNQTPLCPLWREMKMQMEPSLFRPRKNF